MKSTALDKIRQATRALHERIGRGPYAALVQSGSLSIARYASFLRALYAVHGGLDHAVELSGAAAVRSAHAQNVEWRVRLERDLAHLQVDLRGVDAAVLHALVLAQQLRRDGLRSPHALFGHMYVLEGSQLGGLVQAAALEQRAELKQGGLSYLSGAGNAAATQFDAFVATLEANLGDDAAIAGAILGAEHAFEGVEAILSAVASNRLDGPRLGEALNADAGAHPVPADIREVQAALQAGEASYRAWAYYQARYQERGLRFTRSDSAWLVTLAREDPTQALRQVHWLAGVLAARGMPRLLLEQHLELLHASLVAFVPERAAEYEALRRVAAELGAQRKALLSDVRRDELAAEFTPEAPPGPVTPREAGMLLVAAAIDEKCQIANAVESLCAWLCDRARFSDSWCAAAAHTLSRARSALSR